MFTISSANLSGISDTHTKTLSHAVDIETWIFRLDTLDTDTSTECILIVMSDRVKIIGCIEVSDKIMWIFLEVEFHIIDDIFKFDINVVITVRSGMFMEES